MAMRISGTAKRKMTQAMSEAEGRVSTSRNWTKMFQAADERISRTSMAVTTRAFRLSGFTLVIPLCHFGKLDHIISRRARIQKHPRQGGCPKTRTVCAFLVYQMGYERPPCQAANASIFFMLCARETRFHSAVTPANPRREKVVNPKFFLMFAKTPSTSWPRCL